MSTADSALIFLSLLVAARAAGLWRGPSTAPTGSTEALEGYSSGRVLGSHFGLCGLRAQTHCGFSGNQ